MRQHSRLCETLTAVLLLVSLWALPPSAISQVATLSTASQKTTTARKVVVVMGLADSLSDDVRQTIARELTDTRLSFVDIKEQSLKTVDWPEDALIIAAGVEGCRQTASAIRNLPVTCVLLTMESFIAIEREQPPETEQTLSALVIDQPSERQAQVAQAVYPALSRFALITEQTTDRSTKNDVQIDVHSFRPDVALAPQLTQALAGNDALIAIPESSIFSRKSLRTVLLSAYGYRKPVVGLSRAYVKAGALITAYSSPAQIFREIASTLSTHRSLDTYPAKISYPRLFSVIDNIDVARSLGLTKVRTFDPEATYTDMDFQP